MQEQVAQKKVNLGAGAKPLAGYENRDIKNGQPAFPLTDADNSLDEIRASHVLEHFPHNRIPEVLADWVRALKPGGTLKIAVPDFDAIVDKYKQPGVEHPIEGWLMGGQVDEHDQHRSIFNFNLLSTLFRRAGLWRVEPWKGDGGDCSTLPISLNVSGIKPGPCDPLKVHFVMSAPRYGFTLFQQSLASAVQRIPNSQVQLATGAYWAQCLERVIDSALAQKATHVVTLDYDSVFTHEDIVELLWIMRGYPEADAVFPLQAARGWNAPLFCRRAADGTLEKQYSAAEMAQNIVRMESGHFGLTILRADRFARMPRPWLQCVANQDGKWDDGKVDADIGFWQKWLGCGNSLYLAPHVVIGHIAETILWPDEQLGVKTQPANEYTKTGKPPWTWR
jgi:predicted SAM-dependent methyltransferase